MLNKRTFIKYCIGGFLGGVGIAGGLKIYRRKHVLPIVEHPHPLLRQVSRPVDSIDAKVTALSKRMIATLRYEALFEFFTRASLYKGLAAPQVGHAIRLVVCGLHGEINVLINPEIIEEKGSFESKEFCLSLPGRDTQVIKRPDFLKVRYRQLDNVETTLTAQGSTAALLAHEIDHLNGVLYIDH